jgi:hypothetical protein
VILGDEQRHAGDSRTESLWVFAGLDEVGIEAFFVFDELFG